MCDTGCCGHIVERDGEEEFVFAHPYREDPRIFAEELIRDVYGEEHVKDLDWENCSIVEDQEVSADGEASSLENCAR